MDDDDDIDMIADLGSPVVEKRMIWSEIKTEPVKNPLQKQNYF
jgi:hypothetical protein